MTKLVPLLSALLLVSNACPPLEPLMITTSSLLDGAEGVAYEATLEATGGAPPYRWSRVTGFLPEGLRLAGTGRLSGIPVASGVFSFTARVTDTLAQSYDRGLRITINGSAPPLAIITDSLPSGIIGVPYEVILEARGGTASYTWSLSSGLLPDGLVLDPESGVVAGTPTVGGATSFVVEVRDRAGERASAEFTIGIATPTATNLKVAFIGDQGLGPNPKAVLQLIANEGAHMVIHSGDFDYADDPNAWEEQINSVLGSAFPYFASIGNHDLLAWPGYQEKLQARLERIPGASCTGDLGVQSACRYQGLFFLLTGAGTLGIGHDDYIRDQLAQDSSVWSVCSWHKNQREMQVGGKSSEVGWGPYEECRKGGGIIATAHEHSYHRTRTLLSTEAQIVDDEWPGADSLRITQGATFVFVSGLGGRSIRDQERCLPSTFPYGCNGEWALIYTSTQGAKYGALFVTFNVDGDPRKARGQFMSIDGATIDQFSIVSQVEP